MLAVCFLILFLPYTITLLVSGREGIHQEEQLPELEYQTLSAFLEEDFFWMDDETLALMAVIFRTGYIQMQGEQCVDSLQTGDATDLEQVNTAKNEAGSAQANTTEDEAAFSQTATAGTTAGDVDSGDYERLYQAVAETVGQVVMVNGEYHDLPWHALSAGLTRDGMLLGEEYSYIKSVECPLDVQADGCLKSFALSEAEFAETLGADIAPEELEIVRDSADYVLSASAGDMIWQGEELRELLHIPSSCFWLDCRDERIHLTVKGSGHGFGISLYTADCMAREGSTYEEILQTFYEGAACITAP